MTDFRQRVYRELNPKEERLLKKSDVEKLYNGEFEPEIAAIIARGYDFHPEMVRVFVEKAKDKRVYKSEYTYE